MNNYFINQWNRTVSNDSVVVHLGDFGLAPKNILKDIFDKLKGHKILLSGNHDKSEKSMREIGFEEVHRYIDFRKDGKKIFMGHIPMSSYWHDIVLCGHVHAAFQTNGNILNCGVDVQSWRPISWDEIMVYYSKMLGYKDLKGMEIKIAGKN